MGKASKPAVDYYQWIVLLHICFLTFGSYWVYDTPGAIQTQLEEWFGGPEHYTKQMNLSLYSIYSYPNIILAFLGGFVIDRWLGVRNSALLFSGLVLAGQICFAIGIQFRQYYMCLFGRFLFGLGGENLTVAQNAYTVRWFDGPLLALSFAIVLCCSRLGSSINFMATPTLARQGVPFAVWLGTAICLGSFIMTVVLTLLDKHGESRIKAELAEEKMEFKHVLRLPLTAWLVFACTFFFYIAILTFYTVACDIMQNTGVRYDPETAALFLAVPNIVAIFAFPIVGVLLDKYGKSLNWLAVACLMEIVAHLIFMGNANNWFQIHPAVVMSWLGLAYAFGASSLWPMVAFIVPSYFLGTAYGTMTALQNTGLALTPQLIGFLQEYKGIKGTLLVYTVPIIVFVCCALAAAVLTVVLLLLDMFSESGRLNSSAANRATMPPPKLPGGVEGEDDVDVDHSLKLPPMMVGTVYLRKSAPRLRNDLMSSLGIDAPLLSTPVPISGASLEPSTAGMQSPSYGTIHSPLFVRSPYAYGNVVNQ